MKILLLLFFWCMAIGQSNGQVRLTISYEARFEPYRDSTKPIEVINRFLVATRDSLSYSILFFSKNDSTRLPKPLGSKFRGHSTFANFSSRKLLFQSQPFGMRKFLVEDSFRIAVWELHEETKTIAGFVCKKATAKVDKRDITVFYAPDLPGSIGPYFIGGLPGTILQIWWEDSPYITMATRIWYDANEIIEPSIGKKITRREFDMLKKLN